MQVIKRRQQVQDNRIVVNLPEDFSPAEVDIIIIPVQKKKREFKSLSLISVKTKGVEFDRDECHRR